MLIDKSLELRKKIYLIFYKNKHILFSCVISTLCIPNVEFQRVNPTTQVALYSLCDENNCGTVRNIKWNVYHGKLYSYANYTEWTLFNQTMFYENNWFFGK